MHFTNGLFRHRFGRFFRLLSGLFRRGVHGLLARFLESRPPTLQALVGRCIRRLFHLLLNQLR